MKKSDIIIFALVILIIAMSSASSITRRISVSSDNIYTMIRNSNGKYWEASTANIQKSINDLNNKSGIVWLPGNKSFYLTTTVVVWKYITLDLGGSEFKLPNGINTNVVELKDGAGIQNGVIDVSGHQGRFKSGNNGCTSNTSFTVPYACIFLNASSQIHSAHIENMALCSISDGYQSVGQDPPVYYSANHLGRGYGIHLYASNVDTPQLITNVTAESIHSRGFHTVIYIHNERNPVGTENGAYIDRNIFERCFSSGDSYFINISRYKNADETKCTTTGNILAFAQCQISGGSYWGGDELGWGLIDCDGKSNIFSFISGWDQWRLLGDPNWIKLYADTRNCYLSGRILLTEFCLDYGQENTRLDIGDSNLFLSSLITKG